ncbi:hypothetical protein HK405_004075, partial [Cladochytrium tenue]
TYYSYYYFSQSFVTLLVAVTPSLGQSNLAFVVNLIGSSLGQVWAFAALQAWGDGPQLLTASCRGWGCNNGVFSDPWRSRLGLGLWALILALPMEHVYVNTKASPLGLLALLSFSAGLIPTYLNRQNPYYDSPWVRYYKNMATIATVLTFALLLQFSFYPNLARRNLRAGISQVLTRLGAFYVRLSTAAYGVSTEVGAASIGGGNDDTGGIQDLPATLRASLRTEQLQLQALLDGALPTLLRFSAAELRVDRRRLRAADFAEVLARGRAVLDLLNAARVSLQGRTLGREVLGLTLASEDARAARRELAETISLLFFLYASSMLSKHPLPRAVPAVTPKRTRLFRTYRQLARDYLAPQLEAARNSLMIDPSPVATITAGSVPASSAAHAKAPSSSASSRTSLPVEFDDGTGAANDDDDTDEAAAAAAAVDASAAMAAASLARTAETFRGIVRGEAWTRFLSYALAMRLVAEELDGLAEPVRRLFGSDGVVAADGMWTAVAQEDGDVAEIRTIG